MTVPGILRALEEASLYRDALSWAHTDADLGLVDGLDAPALAGLLEKRAAAGHPAAVLAVVPTGRRAESLAQALGAYIPDAEVLTFPAWETLPHERLSPSPDTVGLRLQTLRRIAEWSGDHPLVVVASVRAALQPIAGNLYTQTTDSGVVVMGYAGTGSFGNILAGHITLKVFTGFAVMMIGGLGALGWLGATLPVLMAIALTGLEFLVGAVQAYVFAVLTSMYLNDAIHPSH